MTPETLTAIIAAVASTGIVTGLLTLWGKTGDRRYSDAQEMRSVLKEQIEDLQKEVAQLRRDLRACEDKHRLAEMQLSALQAQIAEMRRWQQNRERTHPERGATPDGV